MTFVLNMKTTHVKTPNLKRTENKTFIIKNFKVSIHLPSYVMTNNWVAQWKCRFNEIIHSLFILFQQEFLPSAYNFTVFLVRAPRQLKGLKTKVKGHQHKKHSWTSSFFLQTTLEYKACVNYHNMRPLCKGDCLCHHVHSTNNLKKFWWHILARAHDETKCKTIYIKHCFHNDKVHI